jgi:hypothetical protein
MKYNKLEYTLFLKEACIKIINDDSFGIWFEVLHGS